MRTAVTVERDGESLIIRIPREIANRLKVEEGDQLHLVRTAGGYVLSSLTEDDQAILRAYGEVTVQYDGVLRRLADA